MLSERQIRTRPLSATTPATQQRSPRHWAGGWPARPAFGRPRTPIGQRPTVKRLVVTGPVPPGPRPRNLTTYLCPRFTERTIRVGDTLFHDVVDGRGLTTRNWYPVALGDGDHRTATRTRPRRLTFTPTTRPGAATPGASVGPPDPASCEGGAVGTAFRCDQTPGLPALAIAAGSTATPDLDSARRRGTPSSTR